MILDITSLQALHILKMQIFGIADGNPDGGQVQDTLESYFE